jgi:nucleoside-diphosphate-sugar epimerase
MQGEHVLILGANGQIGTVLAQALREKFGANAVITTDLRNSDKEQGPHEILNALDGDGLRRLIDKYQINQIYHLAAILSAKGEKDPLNTWKINMDSLMNVLEVCVEKKISKLFYPSTIAIFGPSTPKKMTAQESSFIPTTVYGMSKLAAENWCNYYHKRYGLDVRSLRYPGVIGWQSEAGGGTTDYAVEIFHAALKEGRYSCFLESETRLPMIYMDDCIRATIELMDAPAENITVRTSYNLAGMSFTPAELATEIKKHIPNFEISYNPDFRQAIAASWSESIDDSIARKDWNWKPKYDLEKMTMDMIEHLK